MSTKFVFYSGKGGVGKTSMACTTGVHYADMGLKTLLVTTDPAANLSDVFHQEIGHKITQIKGVDNLFGMEIDSDEATREYKERSLAPLRELFDEEFVKVADEQLSGPCTEEMASFDKFIDYMDQDEYDVVVFDTAPTGHTIRLLELPVDWSKHIDDASKGSGQTCMGPVALIQDSKAKYDMAIEKLRNPSVTEFIFVMQADEASYSETKRSMKEIETLGIKTSGVIVNGLIPEAEAQGPFFKRRYEVQQDYLKRVKAELNNVSIKTMDLFSEEVKGTVMFRRCREKLFGIAYENRELVKAQNSMDGLLFPVNGQQRNIFFSGKGGVGKTSMACITSVYTAQKGYKTLLVTTDPAAHIGQVLDRPVTDQVRSVEGLDNLYAVKIDPKVASEDYKESVLADARGKFNEETVLTIAEEMNSPCTEEMAAFQKFLDYALDTAYDVVVFDTAPTGHTLRLLNLPMDWSKQLEFKAGESTEISDADIAEMKRFDSVINMLKDEDRTTFSFVVYPEKTPIVEAYRASQELDTLGIQTRMLVSNFNIPLEEARSSFFRNRRKMQLSYSSEIVKSFNDAEVVEVPLYAESIKGIDMLKDIGLQIFGS